MARFAILCALLVGVATATSSQSWSQALDGTHGQGTPVTRVVNLLKEMSQTLEIDMEEDETLFKELACWCNSGKGEKEDAVKASTARIAELESTIESGAARSSELKSLIKELESTLVADKQALGAATAMHEKQLAEFHGMETDNVQALENLKAAIGVLSKHHKAPPDSEVAGGAIFKNEKDAWSLLELASKNFPWSETHADRNALALDNFMRDSGFDDDVSGDTVSRKPIAPHKFLQAMADATSESTWSAKDTYILKRGMKSATAFVQARHGADYFPAYTSQSGAIMGVLNTLKEEMESDLKEAQAQAQERSAAFEELRSAKSEEIKSNDKMAEQKEDELAQNDNLFSEAKEDLDKERKVLEEDQTFLKNLNEMCSKGSSDFDARKKARLEEMQAVGETIEILQADEARDAMSSTFSFVQVSSGRKSSSRRQQAAELLRRAGRRMHSLDLSILATSVELDAFVKVKEAIDGMIGMLKTQQGDEVKKNDWCKSELQENEMTTAKTQDKKEELEAKIAELSSNLKTMEEEINAAQTQIAQTQMDLQHATEDRQKENIEFQKTIADQTMTVEVLKKAVDRLGKFYDFLQERSGVAAAAVQTPPVAQKEYKPNSGAGGVMEMIEKLVHDAHKLRDEAKKSETSAQAGYEQLVADSNGSVEALQKEVVSKTDAKVQATQDKLAAESSLADIVKELEGLSKYNVDLHTECDYVLKNFDLRQKTRSEEIEALQQAKQILSGASFD